MSHPPTPPMPLSSRITSGHSTHLGRRNEQQDVAWIETFPSLDKVGSPMTVYGVLDGHGSDGAQVAQWVQTQLSEFFRNLTVSSSLPPVFDKSSWSSNVDDHDDLAWEPRLLDFLESLHDRMLEPDPSSPDGRPPPPFDPYLSGTTLVLLLISRHGTVKVWNIGDSGVAVVSRSDPSSVSNEISSSNWEFLKLTRDHTCKDPKELARVLAAGARVERSFQATDSTYPDSDEGPLRIYKGTLPYPGLVLTRSLGDSVARKLGVLSSPEISEFHLSPSQDHVLIMASDGVWDGLSEQELKQVVQQAWLTQNKEVSVFAQQCAEAVVQAALMGLDAKSLDDNITAICILIPAENQSVHATNI